MSAEGEARPRILIVDDEPGVRGVLRDFLCDSYSCETAGSAAEALVMLRERRFDLVLSDIRMPGMSGLEMLPLVREAAPDAVVVMISAEQAIDSAIEAMRAGVFDYVVKPFDFRQVEAAVARAASHQALLRAERRHRLDLEELVTRRTEERDRLAHYDPLTGLPNRPLFQERLAQALSRAARDGQPLAVMLLGLDQLKSINETLGYITGDEVLRGVAERLSGRLRESDTVARWGGNEFVLLLAEVRSAEGAVTVARKVRESLKPPFDAGGSELYVTASIGISMYPHDGRDGGTLLKNAGAALHRTKQRGGDGYQFYSAEMNRKALDRLLLEGDLRRALERNEFVLHYQPVAATDTGLIVSLEALVRWQHPERGLVPPTDFIPLAEETGLILAVGEWVLRTACAQVRAWQDEGLPPLPVAVNLSGRQFRQRDLPVLISRVLRETGLAPEYLKLELTESCVMEDPEFAAAALGLLKAGGVGVSIDDFGTGYSSLSHLKRFPIDSLKIDRSFVRDATGDEDDAAIVAAVILLARTLRLGVIAEGVETEEQLELLRTLGCGQAQGYLFIRPLPAAELKRLLPRG
jgi:diguanylate cyclase (GGDEF)-like protein